MPSGFASAAARYARRANPAGDLTYPTPGVLARAINPKIVQTPALDVIDAAIVQAYTTPDARLIISMSPQEGKSERTTKTGTLWALINNPDLRIGVASYAQTLAEGFGRDIRNWIVSNNGDEGTLDLGLRIARDNGAARRWQLAGSRGGVICVGIGSGLTGRPLDALVIDDPIADATQADSEYYRDRVWEWWLSVASTRLAPGAPVILILTRWHEDDLAGRLLKAEDGHLWRVINIPAQADHDPDAGETDLLGRKPGEWLKSARGRTREQWEAIKIRAGSRVFNALYQGKPSPDTGLVWKRTWWRRYRTMQWSVSSNGAYRVDCDELIMSWDMTFKDTKSSDYVVGMVLARKGADVFVLDVIRKRLTFTDTLVAFKAMCEKWPQAKLRLVEDKANGTAVIDSLRKKVGGLVAINPTESKYARANAVAPFIEAGNVWLPDPEVALFDTGSLIDEAAAFPNGAHDDQIDALSQGLARLLLDGGGAQAWTEYLLRKAAGIVAGAQDGDDGLEEHAHDTADSPAEIVPEALPDRHTQRQAAFAASRK